MASDAFALGSFAGAIRDGRLTCEEMIGAGLDRIRETEDEVGAWAFLDPDHALDQARARDAALREGRPLGPLHGVPVAVADIVDTADMPTEDGTALHAGRRPEQDATVVSLLRVAGAVIVGKTATDELGLGRPGRTRNPHDGGRTPGPSGGAAAAVAAGMVPVALGTQSDGSVIAPAAWCGVVGFKPSHGTISRAGVLHLSNALDHVGVFATSVDTAAGLAEALMAYDPSDPAMRPAARPELARIAAEEPPLPPRLAFVRSPVWDDAEPATQAAFAELVEFLDDRVVELALPPVFDRSVELHRTILDADAAVSLAPEYERGRRRLSPGLRARIERGRRVLAGEYIRATARVPLLDRAIGDFYQAFDAILTPAVPGEAPHGQDGAGGPDFCAIWTLIGAPAITLPLLQGENGLPVGVQLVGRRGDDARLLRTARWLSDLVLNPKPARRRRRR